VCVGDWEDGILRRVGKESCVHCTLNASSASASSLSLSLLGVGEARAHTHTHTHTLLSPAGARSQMHYELRDSTHHDLKDSMAHTATAQLQKMSRGHELWDSTAYDATSSLQPLSPGAVAAGAVSRWVRVTESAAIILQVI